MYKVIILKVESHNGTSVVNHYFSDRLYRDPSTLIVYHPVLISDVKTDYGNQNIYRPTGDAKKDKNLEKITLKNNNGEFDDLLLHNIEGRPFELYVGNTSIAFSAFVKKAWGAMSRIKTDAENLVLSFTSDMILLNQPLQPNVFNNTYPRYNDPWPLVFGSALTCNAVVTFEERTPQTWWTLHRITLRVSDSSTPSTYADYVVAGGKRITNQLDSINQNADIQVETPEDSTGKITLKQYVYNSTTPIYITGFDNYQINGSAGPLDKENITWSGGTGILTFYLFDSGTQTRFILKTGTIPVNNDTITGASGWTFDINGTPTSAFIDSHPFLQEELRIDANIDERGTGPPQKLIGEVATNIAKRAINVSKISTAATSTFITDMNNTDVGFYTKKDMTVKSALDSLFHIGMGYEFNQNDSGNLHFFVMQEPGITADATITNKDIAYFDIVYVHEPLWKVSIVGNKNHDPFSKFFDGSQSSNAVLSADHQRLENPFQRRGIEESTTIRDKQEKKRSLVIQTQINDTQGKHDAEALRVFNLYSVWRRVCKIGLHTENEDIFNRCNLHITYPYYGFSGGLMTRTSRIICNHSRNSMEVYAWL